MARQGKKERSPTPTYNQLSLIPTPPQGYSYVHIFQNGSKAVLSWRASPAGSIEGRLEYPGDASKQTKAQLQEWAAKHLGTDEPHAINVMNP